MSAHGKVGGGSLELTHSHSFMITFARWPKTPLENRRQVLSAMVSAGLLVLALATVTASEESAADRMFTRLTKMVGHWEGDLVWSGARTGTEKLQADYYLTGNGSSLVENLIMGGVPMMTTVYHLDETDLRMTHYCAAKNQPRLKATKIDEGSQTTTFSFVDMTNGVSHPAHVEAFSVQIVDSDHLHLQFTFAGGTGKKAIEDIALQRVAAKAGPA